MSLNGQIAPSDCDLLIVGAGPAGIAAAITATRAGLHVIVIDKAQFPRDKCCGDGRTTLALRELEKLNFDPSYTFVRVGGDILALERDTGKVADAVLNLGKAT